jgi:pimeloyl-ACP methyl ester carboxylesterase
MVEDFAATGLIDRLAQTHRVLAFDRPGFGESEREDGDWSPEREADLLAEVLEKLGVEQTIVVAHSWATLVAMGLVVRAPASITGLVLLSGYYYSSARLDVALMMPGALPIVGPLVRHTIWPLIARLGAPAAFRYLFSPMGVPAAFRRMYSLPMATRPCQLKSLADDTVTMPSAAHHARSTYSAIKIPVRLIAGINDRVVKTGDQSVRLNRELADSELQLLEGVGHMSHHARPDLVVAAVNALTNRAKGNQMPDEQKSFVGQDA